MGHANVHIKKDYVNLSAAEDLSADGQEKMLKSYDKVSGTRSKFVSVRHCLSLSVAVTLSLSLFFLVMYERTALFLFSRAECKR